ncbi:hypothetical protein M9434_006196 [Picochlorum sp. BPE23]|nr:hypothetical protein M9434_006196 [Picochlorum sp. BPE23]
MFEWWVKRRRLVLAGLAGCGAAAYVAYTYYYQNESDDKNTQQSSDADDIKKKHVNGDTGIEQRDANAHMEHHFNSIQEIARTTTIPSLMTQLFQSIIEYDGVEDMVDRLKTAAQQKHGSLTLKDKLDLWNGVLERVVARCVATVWLVPMVHAQVRVQLNVLGRNLYVQSMLSESESHRGVSRLSAASQEGFLSIAEYIGSEGYRKIMDYATEVSRKALEGVQSAADQVTVVEWNTIVSQALREFENTCAKDGWWSDAMLPPSEYIRKHVLKLDRPDNAALMAGYQNGALDIDAIEAMHKETVHIVQSDACFECIRTSAMVLSSMMSKHVIEHFGGKGERFPLVKIVPVVANHISSLLNQQGEFYSAVDQEISRLGAMVYSAGIS